MNLESRRFHELLEPIYQRIGMAINRCLLKGTNSSHINAKRALLAEIMYSRDTTVDLKGIVTYERWGGTKTTTLKDLQGLVSEFGDKLLVLDADFLHGLAKENQQICP